MSSFLLACAGLLLLFALFVLYPRRLDDAVDDDRAGANREWYRLRQQELAEQPELQDELEHDAQLRLLEDGAAEAPAQAPDTPQGKLHRLALLLPAIGIAVLLYWKLGAAPDVNLARQFANVGQEPIPEQLEALMQDLERRAKERPDNLHYQALLGRYYMGIDDFGRAADVYERLAVAAPQDPQILAFAAQAQYLASDRKLGPPAQMRAEQALALDPHQRTALGLLGMASYEQEQYRAAIGYWQRLLASEPPGSESAQMIQGVIARAQANLGEGGGSVADANPAPTAEVEAAAGETAAGGLQVTVSLPAGASVPPSASVFVLARPADGSRMPIAVQRLAAAQLPIVVELNDGNSMAGQKLSQFDEVLVVAQLSPSGRPGAANATYLAEAGPLAPGSAPLKLLLQPTQN